MNAEAEEPQSLRAGPFYTGILDFEGKGSEQRTLLERRALLSSEAAAGTETLLRIAKEHGRPKLDDIRGYIRAYSVILNVHFRGRYAIIDGFAGPGLLDFRPETVPGQQRLESEPLERELALGSPLLILSNHPNIPVVHLVEKGRREFAALQERINAYYPGWPKLHYGDANVALPKIADDIRDRVDRALFILDPQGLQVKMKTIRKIRRSFSKAELFVLYPSYMGVARCLNSGRTRQALAAFFGDDLPESDPPGWKMVEDYYRGNMVGIWPEGENPPEDLHEALLGLYERRLRESGFSLVKRSPVIRSTRGRPLYHLLFAGDNQRAASIIEDVFRSHGQSGSELPETGPKFSRPTLDRFGAYGDHPTV